MANETCNGLILHYVNYGFQKRGVPLILVSFLKSLRREYRRSTFSSSFMNFSPADRPGGASFGCSRCKKDRARSRAVGRCLRGQL